MNTLQYVYNPIEHSICHEKPRFLCTKAYIFFYEGHSAIYHHIGLGQVGHAWPRP